MTDEVIVQNTEVSAAELEASQFGWVPESEYKGNPEDWKDAETFLKRGKEINGFLRKDLEKIKHKNQSLESELSEIRATMEEFRQYHNETEARAYKRALDDLKKQKVEAIEQGDGARVIEIDDTIESIKEAQNKPAPKVEKPQTNASYDEEYFAWAKTNTWYVTNPEAQAIATLYGQEINAKYPEKKGREFLDEVTRLVKESHPEYFTNPARSVSTVGSSSDGRSPTASKKKGYNDLPAEAKAACDKFVKQKLMTQEQYVAEYQWN